MRHILAAALVFTLPAAAIAQDKPQPKADPLELEAANQWQMIELTNRAMGAALSRLVEDRRKLQAELEALRAKPAEAK